MNVDRMTHLLEMMKMVEETKKSFSLDNWIYHPPADYRPAEPKDEWCGTTCCVMGYAALDPVFIKQGLELRIDISSDQQIIVSNIKEFNEIAHDETLNPDGVGQRVMGGFREQPACVYFKDAMGFRAAALFFDIDYATSEFLFDPSHYRNSKDAGEVIKRIEFLLTYAESYDIDDYND